MDRRIIVRPLLIGGILYGVVLGATFHAVLISQLRIMSAIILLIIVGGWLAVRWLRRWKWYVTALDGAIGLWVVVFALTTLANSEDLRRTLIALWFVAGYILLWYALHDLIENGAIRRSWLVDALVVTAAVIIGFGFVSILYWMQGPLLAILAGARPWALPRPPSTLNNPNTLGGFLILTLPFIAVRAASPSLPKRIAHVILFALGMVLMIATYSRGAWLGAVAAAGAMIGYLLVERGLVTPARIFAAWRSLPVFHRAVTGALAAAGVIVVVTVGVVLLRSLDDPGRTADLRTYLYNTALQMFAEQPLLGDGLFSFGANVARLNSSPPRFPHAHTHNLIFQVMGEMGIAGLFAMLVTGIAMTRAVIKNARLANAGSADPDHWTMLAVVGAGVGTFVHHLFDVLVMNPAMAVAVLIVVVIGTAPAAPRVVRGAFRLTPVVLTGLALVIVATGIWSASLYGEYIDALVDADETGEYAASAARVQAVSAQDPGLMVYHHQYAMLMALAAAQAAESGDVAAEQQYLLDAAAGYERAIQLSPVYSPLWANLAAVRYTAGQPDRAIQAMQRAVELAPDSGYYLYSLAVYEEDAGDEAAALAHYRELLAMSPDSVLSPSWDDSPLRRAAAEGAGPLSSHGQMIAALRDGEVETARALWNEGVRAGWNGTAAGFAYEALLALSEGDLAGARNFSRQLEVIAETRSERAWHFYVAAEIAQAEGNDAARAEALAELHTALTPEAYDEDWVSGAYINYAHYLRSTIPRQFVPQLAYPVADLGLLVLLDAEPDYAALTADLTGDT